MADRAGIREVMNRHRLATTVAAAAVVLLAAGFIAYQLPESPPPHRTVSTQDFYTTDDGQTWFRGPINKAVPFEHEGKEAVRAYVFRCGGTEFVGYLERLTSTAMKQIQDTDARAAAVATRPAVKGAPPPNVRADMIRSETLFQISMYGRELKRPGETEWVYVRDMQRSTAIQQPKCPHDDPTHKPEPVVP
jgi:hypothetical protein